MGWIDLLGAINLHRVVDEWTPEYVILNDS